MSNVSVHDFDDMMRPLARAAITQGWQLVRATTGHVKFVPPKGPIITCSTSNNSFRPNLKMLQEAGLKIPVGCLPAQSKVEVLVDSPPIPKEAKIETDPPKKQKRAQGVVKSALMEFMQSKGEAGLTVDDIVAGVNLKIQGVSKEVVNATCCTAAAKGELVRVQKGVYRWHSPSAAKELSKEEQEMLAEDAQIFDEFMDALAKMQEWANRLRDKSIALNRLKKLLGGL